MSMSCQPSMILRPFNPKNIRPSLEMILMMAGATQGMTAERAEELAENVVGPVKQKSRRNPSPELMVEWTERLVDTLIAEVLP